MPLKTFAESKHLAQEKALDDKNGGRTIQQIGNPPQRKIIKVSDKVYQPTLTVTVPRLKSSMKRQ